MEEINNQGNKGEILEINQDNNIDQMNEKDVNKEKENIQINNEIETIKRNLGPKKRDRRNSIIKLINKNKPLFEIMRIKEKDRKNYDKIAYEFNKIFKIYKLHKKALENKENFEEIKTIQKHKKNNKKINIYKIIEKLKTPTELRTFEDIYLIRKYLKTTHIESLFQNEIKPKGDLYNKLLVFLSFQIKFKLVEKNEILFKIGEYTNFFYLIMEGKIEILKPMSKIHNISGYEYFLELMNYKKKDSYLYSLCIQENKTYFEIKKKDAELIPYIYIIYKLDEIKNRYFVDFRSVLKLVNITAEELGLDPEKIHSNHYIFNKIKQIKLNMPIIEQNELIQYRFLDDKANKKEVILYQYEPFLKIGENNYFGEPGFTGKGVRTGTASVVDDCYFGYWDIQLYNLNFSQAKKDIFDKKVNFLYNNFFFGKINIKKFENHFFNWFLSEDYDNNAIIYKENYPSNYIYFIEEGTIELNSTRTILEIQILLQKLEEKRLSLKEKEQKLYYNNINSEWFDIENKVEKKNINRILILNKNNVLGLESFYYQIPYLTNARVISPTAKIMKIDKDHLFQLLIGSGECMNDLTTKAHSEINILTKRFFSLNNVNLILIDNKISYDEKIKYENYLKDLKKNSILKVNSPFSEKNIKILKKIDIEDIYLKRKKLLLNRSYKNLSTNEGVNPQKIIKKQFSDFFDFLYEEEGQNKKNKNKNKRLVDSATSKKFHDYSSEMNNFASITHEENMLKKVKKEIKLLKENKYFFSEIPTEESEKKKDDNKGNLIRLQKSLFRKNYSLNNNRSKRNSIKSINEKKNKDNELQNNESSIFLTKIENKLNFDENKTILNNMINQNNNSTNKININSSLPSIVKSHNSKNSFNCLSVISQNKNNSIDNKIISTKHLNNIYNNKKLIKSYSFINKNFGNDNKSQQELSTFDPKEKYSIFNDNNLNRKYRILNIRRINKLKGLNEFGFPLNPRKSFIPKLIKGVDFTIKMKRYQEYRRKIERKIEEMNQLQ